MNTISQKYVPTVIRSYEYFKLFNKEVFYNRLSYIWSLAIPIIFLFINNYNSLTTISYESFRHSIFFFWGYMVLITAAEGIGIGLLFMRDSHFLKMYTYITGSKLPIVLGKVFSQCFFLWVNMVVFTLFSGLMYQQPVGSLVFTSFIILIPIVIPVYFLFLTTATLRVKSKNIGPLLTLIVILLVNLAGITLNTGTLLDYLVYLNPASVILAGSKLIHSFLMNSTSTAIWLSLLPLIAYLLIGSIGYKKLDIVSREGR